MTSPAYFELRRCPDCGSGKLHVVAGEDEHRVRWGCSRCPATGEIVWYYGNLAPEGIASRVVVGAP